MDFYLSATGETTREIVIQRSRFICTLKRIDGFDDALSFVKNVKKKYSDATHNCYAFISNAQGTEQRFSDDGEPHGTAGQPMLEVLKKKGIFMTAAVVTRYFGGVKLGAGGLVSAYTRAVAETVENAKIVKNVVGVSLEIKCGYEMYNALLQALKDKVFATLSTDFADNVKMTIAVPKEDADNIEKDITCALLGQVSVLKGATAYYVFE